VYLVKLLTEILVFGGGKFEDVEPCSLTHRPKFQRRLLPLRLE
jgi:hypothetical protein